MTVQDPQDYFEKWVAEARSGDRLLMVLDPEHYLDLDDELHTRRRSWRVYHYDENDLAFRTAYSSRPADPNFRHIVWVTPSPFRRSQPGRLDLSFMADVLRRADRVLDLSLAGLLRVLLPGEVFPEGGLQAYGHILSQSLQTVLQGHRELRREIGQRQPLDIHHVRALALHCLQSDVPVSDYLFTHANARDLLTHYLRLVWSGRIEDQALPLLREQAAHSPFVSVEELQPWFRASPDELALAVYVYCALRRYRVRNALNQLRGLGMLTIDPTTLEAYLDTAAVMWEDETLRMALLQGAEAMLDPERLGDLISLLPLSDLSAVAEALRRETATALVCGLAERFLLLWLRGGATDDILVDELPLGLVLADVETAYSDRAHALLASIREMGFALDRLRHPFCAAPDLATLVDWYVKSGVHRLELAHALAEEHTKKLVSDALHQVLQEYLDRLLRRIWDYLDRVNANLVNLVSQSYDAFLSHPRLSIHVLADAIFRRGFRPTQERCVWILVFDGMRWDSWEETVLPALTRDFEFVDEGKPYVSLLPSVTSVARTGLLAGSAPNGWRAADGRHTSNEAILAARLFDLDLAERDRWLRIELASERDIVQRRLGGDFDRRPVNILIYNISDDWVHGFQGNVAAINSYIAQRMQTVVNDLQRYVREGDLVVVTSDHGFVGLDPEANVLVRDKESSDQSSEEPVGERVFYRYLVNMKHSAGLSVPFHGDRFFTVAKGRTWFQREGGRFARYSHGGISMGELVVPGVTMQRIVEPFVKLVLSGVPRRLEVLEKEPQTVSVRLRNMGNRATKYTVTFDTNSELEGQTYSGTLGPREAQDLSYSFIPVYTPKATESLVVQVTYSDVDGQGKRLPLRSCSVTTKPRKDVVEIDFGGLDQLDEL